MLLQEGPRLVSSQRWRELIKVGVLGLLLSDLIVVGCHPCEQSARGPQHKGTLVARVLFLEGGVRQVHETDRVAMAVELVRLRHGLNESSRSGTGLIHGIAGLKMGVLGRSWGGWGRERRWWGNWWGRHGRLGKLGIGLVERWWNRWCLVG